MTLGIAKFLGSGLDATRLTIKLTPDEGIERTARVIAVHGLAKKTMGLRDHDLDLAEARRNEFLARRKPRQP